MPSIAQQDYKIIAPKQGRGIASDAAALEELKKAILNGIGFACLIKDTIRNDGDINRVLGVYPDGSIADVWSTGNTEPLTIQMPNTVAQYQGLAAVQQAEDKLEVMLALPALGIADSHLIEEENGYPICADGKFLIPAVSGDKLASLSIAETGPAGDDDYINITWEDAQKLIGLPIS